MLLGNKIRGGISSVMGIRYVESDESRQTLYIDANILYAYAMNEKLPFDDIEMWYGHPLLYIGKLE